jgi:hypothetical protein
MNVMDALAWKYVSTGPRLQENFKKMTVSYYEQNEICFFTPLLKVYEVQDCNGGPTRISERNLAQAAGMDTNMMMP